MYITIIVYTTKPSKFQQAAQYEVSLREDSGKFPDMGFPINRVIAIFDTSSDLDYRITVRRMYLPTLFTGSLL